jgi:hypothetical protein
MVAAASIAALALAARLTRADDGRAAPATAGAAAPATQGEEQVEGEADDVSTATPVATEPAAPRDRATLPDFMSSKRRMRTQDLADKVEGGYFTGLPLANSDPDTGFGFGARGYYFNNGPSSALRAGLLYDERLPVSHARL